ncbi:hypothetical protein CCACVL1_23771 [Corchorus capsularis]|uniref:Uncharacterized protein n=1 Tax=Corchorus capsularis TaxID=210143 RepID=A0A1R3GSD6_COCAP|nr:hypothetical protein CCACVL1_23771 [Corchorus capsularis]
MEMAEFRKHQTVVNMVELLY